MLQGTATTTSGAPTIPTVDITPTQNGSPIHFDSQNAEKPNPDRIPQDLSSFIAAGTITKEILKDPNTVLRNAIAGQTITETTVISITSNPSSPLFGGGADDIAFLLGDAAGGNPNANVTSVDATFWIETVKNPDNTTFTQIQYSQRVSLKFRGLDWPHVSVATLRPLQQPGARTFERIASAQTNLGTQYVAISGGQLWHTIQHSDGTWQSEFRHIILDRDPGEFTSVAVAGINDALHVIGIANGQLWHTIRFNNQSWQGYFGLIDTAAPGDPGTFTAVSAFGRSDRDMQVTAISEGNAWFTIRHAAGGWWERFARIPG